ncbi:hypothetical protein GQX74_005801 [Glossina fuscipes]|nr:hypothetical protein GQX74_005801 [Glossina fuscipes]
MSSGRALSRAKSRRNLDYKDVLERLEQMGRAIRGASHKLVMEEALQSYKDTRDVLNTCHAAGVSKKCMHSARFSAGKSGRQKIIAIGIEIYDCDLFPHELKLKPERIGNKGEETKLVLELMLKLTI